MSRYVFPCTLMIIISTLVAIADTERCGMWVDLVFGEPIALEEIIDDVESVDVVYLGESHRVDRHHRFQADIVQSLVDRGKSVVLGIEQMEAIYQPILNQYNEGDLSFDKLAELTTWAERWKNFLDYKPILEAVQQGGGTVVALNAPRETIRTIGRQGMAALTQKQKETLAPEWSFDDPLYRRWMDELMLVHMAFSEEMLEQVFHAQVMRDETMAHTMTHALADAGDNTIGVVLCGSGHASFGLGIPQRMTRRNPDLRHRIILMSDSGDVELTEEEKAMSRDISLTHDDMQFMVRPIANYLHVIEPNASE